MVVNCPDPSYIDSIISSPHLNFSPQFPDARLSFIQHSIGPGVLDDPRYVEWMSKFDPNTEVPQPPLLIVNIANQSWSQYSI